MNRLAGETSPYLLQHAANPVEWYPWGEEALARARAEDRPILLSIGYSACHWCHVMAHESFEDAATADVMNRLFVNVKVDREERPDLDAVYMNAVVGMTGHGGWPMTVFLTPAGEPFHGGTYYPPEARHGLPAFRQVLQAVDRAWREQRQEVERVGANIRDALRAAADIAPSSEPLHADLLTGALPALRSVYDPNWGGFGGAPKFPPASAVGFLLRLHRRTGAADALGMAVDTLDGMALGGMHDLDRRRLPPLLGRRCLARAALREDALRQRSARDGLSGGVRGHGRAPPCRRGRAHARLHAARAALARGRLRLRPRRRHRRRGGHHLRVDAGAAARGARRRPGRVAATYYGVTAAGNFEGGTTVLRAHGAPPEDIAPIRSALLERRLQRPQPGRDDKAIACWNGLALAALAEGGWRLNRPDLLDAARDCARFLLGPMTGVDGRLRRTYRDGSARIPAYLDDHAAVCHGLIELALATGEPEWLGPARRLADAAVARFADERNGGFFQSASDAERLVAPHKELDDNPTPSGNSLLAHVLIRLARIYAEPGLEERAAAAMRLAVDGMRRAPHGFGQMLSALDLHLSDAARGGGGRARGRSGHPRARRRGARRLPPDGGVRVRRRRRCRRDPAARGPPAGRRRRRRLHLRAVRVPGADDRSRRRPGGDGGVSAIDAWRRAAGEEAVGRYVRDGMRLGLGTGSTAGVMLEALAARIADGRLRDVAGVPTSDATAAACRSLGIPLTTLAETPELDVVIDGADEIDPGLDLIKGLGGAHLREKVVASAGRLMVVVADERKLVSRLGDARAAAGRGGRVRPAGVRAAAARAGLGSDPANACRRPALRHRRGQRDPRLPPRRLVRSGGARGLRSGPCPASSSTASSSASPAPRLSAPPPASECSSAGRPQPPLHDRHRLGIAVDQDVAAPERRGDGPQCP